jgi:glycosyltransferase involved in cell wall biosynthesis
VSPDVTVVLPCYNERDHVELEIKRIRAALEAAGMTYELLCIDDGSTDGTREVLQAVDGIRTVLLPRNQGSGTARRIGTQQARGRVVVWTDADMTYPNELIPELVASWTTPTTRSSGPAGPRPGPTSWPGCRPSGPSASWPRSSPAPTSPT